MNACVCAVAREAFETAQDAVSSTVVQVDAPTAATRPSGYLVMCVDRRYLE
jgi:hypothetical protein